MKHISLFSGIGGFDIASEWMGWENVAHVEINPFCRKILKYHFPKATSYAGIKTTDFTIYRGTIDVLSGGFPCQPFSQAGQRKGTEDDRYIWPEMLRAIREIQPRYVVGENVYGLTNWDGGVVFEQVCIDLEAFGYEVCPVILPACAVNAPHRRDRIWFVAHRCSSGWGQPESRQSDEFTKEGFEIGLIAYSESDKNIGRGQGGFFPIASGVDDKGVAPNTSSTGRQKFNSTSITNEPGYSSMYAIEGWRNFPTQSPVCSGNDGIPAGLDRITFPKWRAESVKSYGNAIVPQVALQIFKAIEKAHIYPL